ncbi:LysR substrate-binding domain-containing protein [Liquorilactobacillus satsumensis]|uniref:LysR family transcriptional regulator n=1 Tax=Liquorilactobacillus satsumensis TaxID=259059 RepID=UPI0039E7724D
MDITELITFKAVVEKKSFSAAAEFLGYSQSNVTKHIKKIEEAVGFALFLRGWKATLTKEGSLFYKEVDDLLNHWRSVCSVSREIETEQIGEVRIGIIEPLSKQLLPRIIGWMKTYRPKMNVTFELGNTARLSALVQNDELDCAFCGKYNDLSQELEFEKIGKDEIIIVALNGHELLQKKAVSLSDVLNYPVVYGDKTCLSYQVFMRTLQQQDLLNKLKTHYICSNQLLIPDILSDNQLGILPKIIMDEKKNNIKTLTTINTDTELSYGLIKKKRNYNYLAETIGSITKLAIQEFGD